MMSPSLPDAKSIPRIPARSAGEPGTVRTTITPSVPKRAASASLAETIPMPGVDEAKLAFGVVRPLSDFAESDWAKWWGALVDVDDRHDGTIRIPGAPWRFSSDALSHLGQPAYRGEHNVEIL